MDGLKPKFAEQLALNPPADFASTCATVERMESARVLSSSKFHYTSTHTQPPSSHVQFDLQPSYATPMDVTMANALQTSRHMQRSSAKAPSNQRPSFTKLTDAERARLMALGACLYCRTPHANHTAANCPYKRTPSTTQQQLSPPSL